MSDEPQRWTIAIRVPMGLDEDLRQALWDAVVDAVAAWEPDDRDGWDVDISGYPEPPEDLPEQVLDYAARILGAPGMVAPADVAHALRKMVHPRRSAGEATDG